MGRRAATGWKGAARAALFAFFGGAVSGLVAAPPALGQEANFPLGRTVGGAAGAVQSPVLTLDQSRMFSDSEFGKRVARQVTEAQQTLLAENRKIEAQLSAEEQTLTRERATMAPKAFRKLADAFDAKVQKIRHDQNAKNRIISAWREEERRRFYDAALPILGQLVRDSGAVAILNSQAVFLSFKAIDATNRAIQRLNATLGDGAAGAPKIDLSATPPKPAASQDGAAEDTGVGADPVELRPRAVVVPGAGEAIAPNGALPPAAPGMTPMPAPGTAPSAAPATGPNQNPDVGAAGTAPARPAAPSSPKDQGN